MKRQPEHGSKPEDNIFQSKTGANIERVTRNCAEFGGCEWVKPSGRPAAITVCIDKTAQLPSAGRQRQRELAGAGQPYARGARFADLVDIDPIVRGTGGRGFDLSFDSSQESFAEGSESPSLSASSGKIAVLVDEMN